MWRVAVVGAGTMGTVHAKSYQQMEGVRVSGVVDIRADVGQRLAGECDTTCYETLADLLDHVEVDIVDICLPTYLHRVFVEQAAAAGKHVICEKPIARSLEDARAMIEMCEAAGVKLFVGHVLRFFPEYRSAHDMVVRGDIGRIGTVRTMRGGIFPTAWNDWYASEQHSGTVIVDTIIHDFDFLRWTLGEVSRVYAKSMVGRESNRLDHAFVSLRFESGAIGHVEGTWAFPSGFRTELELAGDEGIISHNSDSAVPIQSSLRTTGQVAGGVIVPESPLDKSPYQAELEHFLHCLSTGQSPIITAEDAYRALQISLAALHSAKTGEPVALSGGGKA